MRSAFRISLALLASFLVEACSSAGTRGLALVPAPSQALDGSTGSLVVRVIVPNVERSPHYVSPSTKGMTVVVKGPTKFKKTVGLVVGVDGCTSKLMNLQCALRVGNLKRCPSKKACYTATIRTYDAYANKKIPPGAHLLSAVHGFQFFIGKGTTVVPLALDGIPASIAFIPAAASALTGTQSTGFIYPKCAAAAQAVNVIGVDAAENFIVGPGAPAISLVSANPSQLSVGAGPTANAFILRQPASPAYAYGDRKVVLTATATPSGKKLGAGAVKAFAVTYSGDICGKFSEFAVLTSGAHLQGITSGPDGNLWATEFSTAKIARVTTLGTVTEFPIGASAEPVFIVGGPDGDLWFTEFGTSRIGRMTTAGSVVFEKHTTSASSNPEGIAVGSDGNLWFVESSHSVNKVAAITPAGTLLPEVSIPTASSGAYGIASGLDGALWFTEQSTNKIGRITTARVITEYSLPSGAGDPSYVTSARGALWFTEDLNDAIGRIDLAGHVTSQYALTSVDSPGGIVAGPDGAMWFADFGSDSIGRLTFDGTISRFTIPTAGAAPFHIVAGSDGALWFTEYAGNKVGRLR